MDCHVHVDDICICNPQVAKHFKQKVGDVKWKGGTTEQHVRHIEKDNIEQMYALYEKPESVVALREASPHCDVRAMLFVRDVSNVDEQHLEELHKQDLLQGLKVHPVADNYELTTQNLRKVLSVASRFNLPVLYHSDERERFMSLTSPELQEELIRENPEVRFIIGHGGAYAHPRLVGEHPNVKAYWNGSKGAPYPRTHLVQSALSLATNHDNAFYDLSIATNAIKAKLIARFVDENPDLAEKILIGTDFPIGFASAQSQLNSLKEAGLKKAYLERIAANRLE